MCPSEDGVSQPPAPVPSTRGATTHSARVPATEVEKRMAAVRAASSLREFLSTEPSIHPDAKRRMVQTLWALDEFGISGF